MLCAGHIGGKGAVFHEERLLTYLLDGYVKEARPVNNPNHPVHVSIRFSFVRVEDMVGIKKKKSCNDGMARLNRIWRSNTISFANKLCKFLFTSMLFFGCETARAPCMLSLR